jgi:GTP-binding protein
MLPPDGSDPLENALVIQNELSNFSPTLARRPRWLVLNKTDLLPEESRLSVCQKLVDDLEWQGPVFFISALTKEGTDKLCNEICDYLDDCRSREAAFPDAAQAERDMQANMQLEAREQIEKLRLQRLQANTAEKEYEDDEDDEGDDDHEVEVVYSP